MAQMKSRPNTGAPIRKTEAVGPEYPESHYRNPWNMGIDKNYGDASNGTAIDSTMPGFLANQDRTLYSPTSTPEAMGAIDLNPMSTYDGYWEVGLSGGPAQDVKRGKNISPTRWTPKGAGKGRK